MAALPPTRREPPPMSCCGRSAADNSRRLHAWGDVSEVDDVPTTPLPVPVSSPQPNWQKARAISLIEAEFGQPSANWPQSLGVLAFTPGWKMH